MSKVDVVQQHPAGTAAPPPVPSLGSAMAAAAAVATVATTAASTASTTATTTTNSGTTGNSTISELLSATIGLGSGSTTPAATATAITTGVLHQPLLSTHTHSHTKTAIASHSQARTNGTKRPRPGDHRDGRLAKSRQRPVSAKNSSMEPPVLSFYGTQPVPLPSRFASLKKRLVDGHESALEASWGRLIAALRDEIRHIDEHRTELLPSIDFTDISDARKVAPFETNLKRHGIGVIRGVVPPADARSWVKETKKYLETKHDFKPPPAQDPTCFDFFWTPAQVRSRAHPNMLRAQRFAMSLWNSNDDDRLATRFPITYADRIRIESTTNGVLTVNGVAVAPAAAPVSPEDNLIAAAAAAASSNASIAQIDNGSLERWELDGYGRCGLYDEIFRGNWEAYNAWDPAGRVNATSDLYNGAGACSMMRMFQGILALTVVEPGMIRLLPSPKLSTVYFLLRPFFSPKEPAPEDNGADREKWERYLDPSNWTLDREQTTIIHGAVPGHAQRVTAAWHPHLQLDKSLVTPPTLQAGDYIIWHPDQAYQFSNTHYRATNSSSSEEQQRSNTKENKEDTNGDTTTSMLVYSPAAPLTQTNALFLARQRKAFLRGHPGPDFDSTGTGLGSEAPHTGRLGEREIREVGGEEGLRAMGLAPWTLRGHNHAHTTSNTSNPNNNTNTSSTNTNNTNNSNRSSHKGPTAEEKLSSSSVSTPRTTEEKEGVVEDLMMLDDGTTESPASTASTSTSASASASSAVAGISRAESEVVRLANIILFPDRYDFYMPTRASSPVPTSREREKEREKEEKGKEKDGGIDENGIGDGKRKRKELGSSSSDGSLASASTSRDNEKGKEKNKERERER
ncbi:hypothetical protein F4678DRAFT_444196 [Xylaria arbuscula]|nr:hypothetical protein F4678DRAFT_444196 [Xylaria arbuscula]